MKTLLEIFEKKGKGSFVRSPTNKTSKYKLLNVYRNKNLALLSHRGKGILGYFKIYYSLFTLNNSRWEKLCL